MNTLAAQATLPHGLSNERRFHLTMSVALLATVILGFSRSYYLRPLFPDYPVPTERIFVLHGMVFSAWFVLQLVQTSLIAGGRAALHRTLGGAGAVLAASMVVIGTYSALIAAARPNGFIGIPVPGWQFLIVPIADMVLFASFVTCGVLRRREPQAHKRFMLLASIALIDAAVSRWPGVHETGNPLLYFGITDLFVITIWVRDRIVFGKLHRVALWGGLAVIASQGLRLALLDTSAWHAIATAMMSLVQ